MGKMQVTQEQVAKALRETGGIISEAAKVLGLASSTSLRTRIKNNKTLSALLDEIREDTKDLAEGNILKAMKDGDKTVSQWYLNSLGRDRGYGNKVEIDGKVRVEKEVDLSGLSLEELKQLEEIAKKVTGNSSTD